MAQQNYNGNLVSVRLPCSLRTGVKEWAKKLKTTSSALFLAFVKDGLAKLDQRGLVGDTYIDDEAAKSDLVGAIAKIKESIKNNTPGYKARSANKLIEDILKLG